MLIKFLVDQVLLGVKSVGKHLTRQNFFELTTPNIGQWISLQFFPCFLFPKFSYHDAATFVSAGNISPDMATGMLA